jgi:multisubunit Na+/H+ antiporter MnhC subunit
MAGLGHIGFGFAAKPVAPKVHLIVLLIATELIDILWALFYFTGIDRNSVGADSSPWSHSLFMSVIWSILAALITARIYRDRRSGIIIGLLVFSHWVIDFITHPMGAIFGGTPLPPDLPLFFNGSSRVGLGLYNHSLITAIVTDIGMLFLGFVIYVIYRIKREKQR